MPSLELLLAGDSQFHRSKLLIAHHTENAVAACETGESAIAMLPDTLHQIRRHANVDRAIALAGEDIDSWLEFRAHGEVRAMDAETSSA